MAGPWEDYQTPTAVQDGPWNDFKEPGAIHPWDDYSLNDFKEPAKDNRLKKDELAKQTFQARLEGEQAKALTGLTDIGTEAAKAVVRAASYVDPTGFTQGLMQQYGVEPTHVIPPEVAHRGGEIVSEAAGEGLRKLGITHDIVPKQVQKPIREFAAENIAALPEMLPALITGATVAPRPIGRLFQAQMIRGVPESAYVAATAETPEERLKAGLGAGMGLAFPALIERGMRQPSVPIPDFVGRQLEMQRGAIPPRGEPVAPIERVTPEQAAIAAERMSAPFAGEVPKFEETTPLADKPAVTPTVTEPAKPEVAPTEVPKVEKEFEIPSDIDQPIIPKGQKFVVGETLLEFSGKVDKNGRHEFYELDKRGKRKQRYGRVATEDYPRHMVEQLATEEKYQPAAPTSPMTGAPTPKPAETPVEAVGKVEAGIKPIEAYRSMGEKPISDLPESQSFRNSRDADNYLKKNVSSDTQWEGDQGVGRYVTGVAESRATHDAAGNPYRTPETTVSEAVFELKNGDLVAWDYNEKTGAITLRKVDPNDPRFYVAKDKSLTAQPAQPIPQGPKTLESLTAKIESGQKLTAAEKKQYLKLRDEATKKEPEAAQAQVSAGEGEAGGLYTPPIVPSTAPPTPPAVPVKAISQIIRDLSKGLNVPVRFGRLTTSKYAGYFKKIPNLIGARRANELPIVAHEVGHKLDSLYNISSDATLRAELDALGDPARLGPGSSWTPTKSNAYKYGEGVAEFIRQWIDDPAKVASVAPNMNRYFDALLIKHNDMARVLNQAQENLQLWKNAPPLDRLDSSIVRGEGPVKARYGISNLTRDLVDDLHFLKLATEEAKKGADIPASQDPYVLARLLRGTFGMADTFIRRGVVDFKTKNVSMGTGLEDILKPISGRVNDFRRFIVAKRAKELMDQGRNTGLQPGDVAEALRVYQSPEFQATFDKLKAWNDSLLQYSLDAGMLKPETAKAMREMNQDYVPFHRFFEIGANELNAEQGSGVGRGLNVGTPGSMRRLTGSNRDIVDPLETMVRNAYAIITASEKNAINVALADLAEKPNMGRWVERVKTPVDPHKVQMADIRRKLEAMGADVSMIPDDAEFTFFRRAGKTPYGENIIKVVRDGNAEYYRVNGDLYETFHALDYDLAGKFIRLFSQPAQLLRAGVTLSPDFSVMNALRDTVSSAVISRYSMVPFLHTAKGVFNLLGGDPKLAAEWAASGGKQAIETTYFDAARIQKFLRRKLTNEMTPVDKAKMYISSPLMALRRLSGLFEEGTRLGQYEVAYKKLRSEGVPEGDARRMAAYEARDLQDFAKGGANTKPLRMLAAFWNAALQGNVKLAQAFKERPVATTAKGLAYITLPKLMEQAINWNEEDYWDRPQWERDLFFLFPRGKDENGRTEFVRVPVPFEVGVIFASLPGRITQWLKENRPDAMAGFPELMLKQTVPNPTPQWLLTLFEVNAGKQGYSIYRGRPVVPTSVAEKAEELQFTEQNSLTARKVGKALGMSPAKVDYAIQGTTGGLGKMAVHQISDRVIQAITGEKPTAQNVMPGGRFFTTPAGSQSDAVERFYRALENARKDVSLVKEGREGSGDYKNAKMLEAYAEKFGEWRSKARKTADPIERQGINLRIAQEAKIALGRIEKSKRQ